MKKFLFYILSTILISSCDFVTFPVENATPNPGDTTTGFVQRKVLIEDYTGHKCPNCPKAAIIANNLIQTHGDKVVVIAVHAGNFADPYPPSLAKYLADFRTTAGNTYLNLFGITQWPSGMVNRKNYTTTSLAHILGKDVWATEVSNELQKPAMAKLEIKNTYNTGNKELTCEVKTTFLYDTLTNASYSLIVMLTQDSIVNWQWDASLPNVHVPNYIHQHVLRANLNGTWGDAISSTPVTKNVPITKTYTYTLPSTYPTSGGINSTACEPKHCHIVAFLYNDLTKEVIQVEQEHVMH